MDLKPPATEKTFSSLTLTELTANRLVASDVNKKLVSSDAASWIAGTANQIIRTDGGDGSVIISAPQDIHTGATNFTVAGATITNAAVLSSNSVRFQPATDATNFFQVIDVDGGNPVFNVDTINERIGVRTPTPSYTLDVRSGPSRFEVVSSTLIGGGGDAFAMLTMQNGVGDNYLYLQTKVGGGDPGICLVRVGNDAWLIGYDSSDGQKLKISAGNSDLSGNAVFTLSRTGDVLLAGALTSTTHIGGAGSGDDITFQSTSHATKGHFIFDAGVLVDPTFTTSQVTIQPGVSSPGTIAVLCVGDQSSTVIDWCAIRAIGNTPLSGFLGQIQAVSTNTSGAGGGGGMMCYSDDGAAMASGDRLGYFLFGGSKSASGYSNSAGIVCYASENWVDANAYGAKFQFETVTNGATSRTAKLTIENNGWIGMGGPAPTIAYDGIHLKVADTYGITIQGIGGNGTTAELKFLMSTTDNAGSSSNISVLRNTWLDDDMSFTVGGNLALKLDDEGGIHTARMRSGANQGAAGAAVGELWHDTTDDTVKMGV